MDTEQSATGRIMTSELDANTKVMMLRALRNSKRRDCAKEAHKALRKAEAEAETTL
jgi:hypothetical protein